MVNQAFRIKIAYRSEKKKEEKENTRDRSVPDGSDKEQVGQGVSQDIVVSLLKNISRKIFPRKPKNSNRMMMRRKSK